MSKQPSIAKILYTQLQDYILQRGGNNVQMTADVAGGIYSITVRKYQLDYVFKIRAVHVQLEILQLIGNALTTIASYTFDLGDPNVFDKVIAKICELDKYSAGEFASMSQAERDVYHTYYSSKLGMVFSKNERPLISIAGDEIWLHANGSKRIARIHGNHITLTPERPSKAKAIKN